MESSYKYNKVDETDAFIPDPGDHPRQAHRSKTATILTLLAAALLGFLTSAALTWISHLPPTKLHCGSNVAEAQALGCKFDLLSVGWIPEKCFDSDSEAEYRAWVIGTNHSTRGPFPYFKDANFTQRIDGLEALSLYEGIVYTTMREHLAHCAQLMRRTHRVALEGGRKKGLLTTDDEGVVGAEHIAHCVKMLWEQDDWIARYNFTTFGVQMLSC